MRASTLDSAGDCGEARPGKAVFVVGVRRTIDDPFHVHDWRRVSEFEAGSVHNKDDQYFQFVKLLRRLSSVFDWSGIGGRVVFKWSVSGAMSESLGIPNVRLHGTPRCK